MDVNFENHQYYPALRTRPAEMYGYMKLSDETKNDLLPIITLGAWRAQDGSAESLSQLQKAVNDRPFILDLSWETAHQDKVVRNLLDADDNFKAWQSYVTAIPNAIPVVQITSSAKNQQIIRQTRQLEKSVGKVAFRITDFLSETDKVTTALSAMDSPNNALVIIDVGYIRETMAASIAACVTAINQVREDVEDAIIAVVSTSFPASVTSHLDPNSGGKRGIMAILERVLHQEIGGPEVAIYGDHSSIHAKVYPTSGGRYTPRIDYPLYDAWVFERRPDTNSNGYIDAAQDLIKAYPEITEDDSWGAAMIKDASNGVIDGMKTPSSWIAARVNMHITRQLELSSESSEGDEEDFEDLL